MRYLRWLAVPAPLVLVLALWGMFPSAQGPYYRDGNLPEYAYATAFADRANIDGCIRVSDVGPGDSIWCSDGTNLLPIGGKVLIDQAGPTSGNTHTGDTLETELFSGTSISIPANILGANGCFEIDWASSGQNDADAQESRAYWGAAGNLTDTYLGIGSHGSTASNWARRAVRVCNQNATNSQVGSMVAQTNTSFGTAGNTAALAASVDTTAETFVSFSGEVSVAADTLTLESYVIWAVPSP